MTNSGYCRFESSGRRYRPRRLLRGVFRGRRGRTVGRYTPDA